MRIHNILALFIVLYLFTFPSISTADNNTKELIKNDFKETWNTFFLFQPIMSLKDKRAHVDTWLLTGKRQDSSMLCVLLADIMFSKLGRYSFYPNAPINALLAKAQLLKGEKLTETEEGKIKVLQKRIPKKYRRSYLFKAHAPRVMKDIIGNMQDIRKAIENISIENGFFSDYGTSEQPNEKQILQLLNEGNVVILERKSKRNPLFFRNDDGRWRLLFGAFFDASNHLRFLVNIPEETVLMEKWPWHGTYDALESVDLSTIYDYVYRRSKATTYTDVRSLIDNKMCNSGFLTYDWEDLQEYRLHAIRNWRWSVDAWDGELRKILGLPKEGKQKASPKPGASSSSSDLWRYYFWEHRGEAGLAFEGSLIPEWHLATGRFAPLEAALLSAVAMQRKDFVGFGLSHPGRLFHTARLFLGNSLLLPTQEELERCKALDAEVLGKYKATYGELPREPYYWDSPGYSNDYMERSHPDYKSPHSLQEHISHSLPQILKGVTSVQEGVARMEEQCAWTARVEGGPGTDWETVKLAIWRQIPVILEGKEGDWRIAVAYLVHNGKRLLLATKKQGPKVELSEPVLREYTLPKELPVEMEFLDYDESQWTPWFVHHFEPTVKHLLPQILEIFKGHPEVQRYLEEHPELKEKTP